MGADPLTFAGLAGMGDLILTTTGQLEPEPLAGRRAGRRGRRSRSTRRSIARWRRASTRREGAVALGRRAGVELPICEQVPCTPLRREDRRPQAVGDLMERTLKSEQWR